MPLQSTSARTAPVRIGRTIRKQIADFARKLSREHRAQFASNPLYRKRAGQFLTALLPLKSRRRRRPGGPDVTKAIQLLRAFKRQYPNERAAEHWAGMYPMVIPDYSGMNPVVQRDCRRITKTSLAESTNAVSLTSVPVSDTACPSPWHPTTGCGSVCPTARRPGP